MIYGRRMLLAKENLKVKNYLIENPLRNLSTPRIHDSSSPSTAELLRLYGEVCEDFQSMDELLDHRTRSWIVKYV
jgi:hypothetical protein